MRKISQTTAHESANMLKRAIFVLIVSSAMAYSQSSSVFKKLEELGVRKTEAVRNGEPTKLDLMMEMGSRFAGNETNLFINARLQRVSMKKRATDPFGLYQDPKANEAEEKKKAGTGRSQRTAALPETPLSEIVNLIKVTTIMPAEKRFLVGGREFREGEEFSVVYQGRLKTLKVMQVRASEVVFVDVDKDEKAALEITVLPEGMSAIDGELRPPGIIGPDDEIPLELGGPGGLR